MPSEFVLGPSLDNVIEPIPGAVPVVPAVKGRRQVAFQTPPTLPGGKVFVAFTPAADPADVLPVNVYAFFCQPVASVPPPEQRAPDWFFKNGLASTSIHSQAADANGNLSLTVPGVAPSLQPYFVQIVLEFTTP
jgi:hypothetical protein